MNSENIKAQMRKGILEYCILSILNEHAMYTNDIIEKLKSSKLIVVEGTLYPLLTRLKNSEILKYEWVESNSGPPRKYYSLTKKGEEFLEDISKSWKELQSSVNKITKTKR